MRLAPLRVWRLGLRSDQAAVGSAVRLAEQRHTEYCAARAEREQLQAACSSTAAASNLFKVSQGCYKQNDISFETVKASPSLAKLLLFFFLLGCWRHIVRLKTLDFEE